MLVYELMYFDADGWEARYNVYSSKEVAEQHRWEIVSEGLTDILDDTFIQPLLVLTQ